MMGRLSIVDLLELASLDELIFVFLKYFALLQKIPKTGGQLYYAFRSVSVPWIDRMDRRTDERIDRRTDGGRDRWIDGQIDRWIDK